VSGRRPAPSTPPPPPAVQKLALRYAKRGTLRFASHRVLQRAFERAVRRADLPIAYSAGFTPHPRLSYLGAAPTGAASEAEYLLLRLSEVLPPALVQARLNAVMPPGLPILQAVTWDDAVFGDLAKQLTASLWQVELDQVDGAGVAASAAAFWALEEFQAIQVRPGPTGAAESSRGGARSKPPRQIEVRGNVLALDLAKTSGRPCPDPGKPCAILEMVLRHATPVVRPDDVIAALAATGLEIGLPPRATRLAQGVYAVETGLVQPFSRIAALAPKP
jgi:radical SAM-linked protein